MRNEWNEFGMNERFDALDGLRGQTWDGTTIMAVMHSRALLYYVAVGRRESVFAFLALRVLLLATTQAVFPRSLLII